MANGEQVCRLEISRVMGQGGSFTDNNGVAFFFLTADCHRGKSTGVTNNTDDGSQ